MTLAECPVPVANSSNADVQKLAVFATAAVALFILVTLIAYVYRRWTAKSPYLRRRNLVAVLCNVVAISGVFFFPTRSAYRDIYPCAIRILIPCWGALGCGTVFLIRGLRAFFRVQFQTYLARQTYAEIEGQLQHIPEGVDVELEISSGRGFRMRSSSKASPSEVDSGVLSGRSPSSKRGAKESSKDKAKGMLRTPSTKELKEKLDRAAQAVFFSQGHSQSQSASQNAESQPPLTSSSANLTTSTKKKTRTYGTEDSPVDSKKVESGNPLFGSNRNAISNEALITEALVNPHSTPAPGAPNYIADAMLPTTLPRSGNKALATKIKSAEFLAPVRVYRMLSGDSLINFLSIASLFVSYGIFGLIYIQTMTCNGCSIPQAEITILPAVCVILLIAMAYLVYKIRDVPDPMLINRELVGAGIIWILGFLIYAIFELIFPEQLYLYIAVIAALAVYIVIVPLQVYLSYVVERKITVTNNQSETLEDILKDKIGRFYFMAHLSKEVSLENYLFWRDATRWVKDYDILYQTGDLEKIFYDIYNLYCKRGAVLEVNVSGKIHDTLLTTIGYYAESRISELPRDVFKEYLEEIWDLLDTYSFNRFLASDLYKKFKEGTLPLEDHMTAATTL